MKKRTAEMVEALKAEGIRTEDERTAAIRDEKPLDLSLMVAEKVNTLPARAAG